MFCFFYVQSTLSYDNFIREGWGVLQFLRPEHARLVPVLGESPVLYVGSRQRSTFYTLSYIIGLQFMQLLRDPLVLALVRPRMYVRRTKKREGDRQVCRLSARGLPLG